MTDTLYPPSAAMAAGAHADKATYDKMYAESIAASLPVESAERANVQLISEVLAKAIEDARQTIDYLKPRVVDEVGLVSALEVAVNDDRCLPFVAHHTLAVD